jgi:hypothetical protein
MHRALSFPVAMKGGTTNRVASAFSRVRSMGIACGEGADHEAGACSRAWSHIMAKHHQ